MLRGELEQLIQGLDGDEHDWIDLKQHYPIDEESGDEKRADFIKDIAAMANTVSLEPNFDHRFLNEDERYIIVGVHDETGDIVGTTSDLGQYVSLLGEDSSVPQNILSDYLTPKPTVKIHKFDSSEPYLVILVIKISNSPPVTVSRELGDELSIGDVYIRDGDRNRPATREDYQKFIQFHLEKEREYITEGINHVVGLNIDYLRDLGEFEEADTEDQRAIPVREGEDGPMFQPSLRDPIEVDNVARELNADVTKWRTRKRHSCDEECIYEYYINSPDLEFTEEQLSFLVQSSWKNGHVGSYWVYNMDSKDSLLYAIKRANIQSLSSNDKRYLGELLSFLCSTETVREFVDYADMVTSTSQSHGALVMRAAEETEPNQALRQVGTYNAIDFESPDKRISNMEVDELIDIIHSVSSDLYSISVDSPTASPSALKGWMRNAEVYLAYKDEIPTELDDDIRAFFSS